MVSRAVRLGDVLLAVALVAVIILSSFELEHFAIPLRCKEVLLIVECLSKQFQ